jgi:hypothetical protein
MGKFREAYKQIEAAGDPAHVVSGCLDDDPAARAKALQAIEAGMSPTQVMVFSKVSLEGIAELHKQALEVLPEIAALVRSDAKVADQEKLLLEKAPLVPREIFVSLLTTDTEPVKLETSAEFVEAPKEEPKEPVDLGGGG